MTAPSAVRRGRGGASALVRRGLEALARAAVRAWSRASMPRPRALRVAGLSASTTVRFDEDGVPHVRAATDADAFRAVGACHALDRFFAMDATRRVLRGRLSGLVGERAIGRGAVPGLSGGTTVDADRLLRVLDLDRAARRELDAATDEERALLDAYCAGVNAVVRGLGPRTSPEHAILRAEPEPWTPLDCCLMAKGMALGLSFKWRSGPVLAAVAEALASKPEHLRAILPRPPGPGEPVLCRVREAGGGLADALEFLGWSASPAGSNAFAVGPARSASGAPLLASDPHLDLGLPGVWYLASVRGGAYAAVGATLPGSPGVVLGRTPTVAWGLTNGMIDDGDLWTEEVDGTGTRYRVDGAWRELEVETQEIPRRGTVPALFRVRRTHRGALFTDALPGYAGPPMSLGLTLHETTGEMRAFLALGRARVAAEVERAVEGFGAPAQNLLYATTEGVVGYRLIGRVPLRRPSGPPILPRDGRASAADWAGHVPDARLPALRLPADGVIATANDAHAGPEYAHYLSCLYEPPWRALRIRGLLEGRRGLRREDLAAVQTDTHSLGWEAFRRAVVLPHAEAIRATRPPAVPALDRVLAATGSEGTEAVGPAVGHLLYHHLARRVFGLHLGDELALRWMACVNLLDAPLLAAFTDPASPWARPAVRATLVGEALEAAARDLAARGLPLSAPWGDLHTLTLRHALSAVPLLGAAFTLGPFPAAGGPFTPCSGMYRHDRPAAVSSGVSYRHVVDLADPEHESGMISFAGQSGHPGSPHYGDLYERWRDGKFLPMRLDRWPERGRDLRLLPA